ncbi:hypothetical protein DPMN_052823 [Dreissena polymorpha]|uniref:Uncharacterized protein n=2 Tax=Dreissena polymorpha TaxID=45954 RepID=A0A9D4CLN2_DREPO|nr:hypothetical protein DPMN_052725 [Dreissena polymorpha]KAH3726944.1 hypothetical protein DPMN_052823 [Dreissena polymorpha]
MRIVLVQNGHTYANATALPDVHRTCNVSSSHYCTGCGWTMDEEYRQNIQNRENPIRLSNTVELIEIIQDE